MGRRALLGLLASAAALAGAAPRLLRWRARRVASYHSAGPPLRPAPDAALLRTIAGFTGALFGRRLSAADVGELVRYLGVALRADGAWYGEYVDLAGYLDRESRRLGSPSFERLDDAGRERLLAELFSGSVRDRRSSLLALLSAEERARRRFRSSTLRQLTGLYRRSGVPWRFRGYRRWPGTAGDNREYTRAGAPEVCA